MKKIVSIYSLCVLCAALLISSCKKQDIAETIGNEQPGAPPPCTGDTWTQITTWPFNVAPTYAEWDGPVFAANNKLYLPSANTDKMFVYDGTSWAVLPSNVYWYFSHQHFTAWTIGTKGYGFQDDVFPLLLEYNTITNVWSELVIFPQNPVRYNTSSFVIGSKAYVIGGQYFNGQNFKDVWEFNPVDTSFTQKSDLPASITGRGGAAGFSINGKGYMVGGERKVNDQPTVYYKTTLEYNPVTDTWTTKTPYPGAVNLSGSSRSPVAFVIGSSAYVSLNGQNFYKYYPATDTWTEVASFTGSPNLFEVSGVIGSRGYVFVSTSLIYPMYRYTPKTCSGGSLQ